MRDWQSCSYGGIGYALGRYMAFLESLGGVSHVSGDPCQSHVCQFVSGAMGIAGATVAPETPPIFC